MSATKFFAPDTAGGKSSLDQTRRMKRADGSSEKSPEARVAGGNYITVGRDGQ